MNEAETIAPTPTAPLRNRVQVRLDAAAPEVWALVGNLSRFPEYSQGLEQVDAETTADGTCTGYVCYFRPTEEGGERIVHHERMTWYRPLQGWASIAAEDNPFGLDDSFTHVLLEPSGDGTVVLTWEQFYDAQDVETMTGVFDDALADIGDNLIGRFGGEILERFVDR